MSALTGALNVFRDAFGSCEGLGIENPLYER